LAFLILDVRLLASPTSQHVAYRNPSLNSFPRGVARLRENPVEEFFGRTVKLPQVRTGGRRSETVESPLSLSTIVNALLAGAMALTHGSSECVKIQFRREVLVRSEPKNPPFFARRRQAKGPF
jgi:hypothetical protein